MAVIGINYDGGNHQDEHGNLKENPINYKSVYLHLRTGELIFNSGNFPKDWYEAKKKFLEVYEEEVTLSGSSSVDHFIMDGAPYESAYIIFNDEGSVGELIYEHREDGWEMFVDKGTRPTWEELKESFKL